MKLFTTEVREEILEKAETLREEFEKNLKELENEYNNQGYTLSIYFDTHEGEIAVEDETTY